MVDISKLGIQQSIIDTKQRAQPQVVKSLSEAMDIANKDAGDEAIVEIKSETGETQYAVVDLKAGTKTAAVFDPNSTDLHFGAITRQKHHTEGTVQSSSNRLEVVDSLRSKPGSNLAAQTQSTLALAQAALDKVSGFNSKEAPFGQRVVSYDHNLETVNTLLDQSSEQINARLKPSKRISASTATPPNKKNTPNSKANTTNSKPIRAFSRRGFCWQRLPIMRS